MIRHGGNKSPQKSFRSVSRQKKLHMKRPCSRKDEHGGDR